MIYKTIWRLFIQFMHANTFRNFRNQNSFCQLRIKYIPIVFIAVNIIVPLFPTEVNNIVSVYQRRSSDIVIVTCAETTRLSSMEYSINSVTPQKCFNIRKEILLPKLLNMLHRIIISTLNENFDGLALDPETSFMNDIISQKIETIKITISKR